MCSTYGRGEAQLFFRVCPPSFIMKTTDAMMRTSRVARWIENIKNATFAES